MHSNDKKCVNKMLQQLVINFAATRVKMAGYWDQFSKQTDEVSMMLDANAQRLGKEEIPELLEQLPDLKGHDVLELGAGIG